MGERAIGRANPMVNAGSHISPSEFHAELKLNASEKLAGSSSEVIEDESSSVVLVDVRNKYETRIGKLYPSALVDSNLGCVSVAHLIE